MEERFPKFFVKYFEYPMIILTKKKRALPELPWWTTRCCGSGAGWSR
jgi:hypothetical protein